MLDIWDEARPDELDTEADATLDVGKNLPNILMNEIDADGDKPDQHFDRCAAENSTVADELEGLEVFKQFVMDQWSGNVEEMVAALNLAWSTDVKPVQSHMSWVRMLVSCCADTDEVVKKYCFLHWVRCARQNKTVFDKAACELIGRLVANRS